MNYQEEKGFLPYSNLINSIFEFIYHSFWVSQRQDLPTMWERLPAKLCRAWGWPEPAPYRAMRPAAALRDSWMMVGDVWNHRTVDALSPDGSYISVSTWSLLSNESEQGSVPLLPNTCMVQSCQPFRFCRNYSVFSSKLRYYVFSS